ncbi:hypothetical protein DFH09DRAFT_1328379 [Mycena vulgaris]|nr:hypothetical protein DFH09DRAFT_1328379 [Mycena vulgaris]
MPTVFSKNVSVSSSGPPQLTFEQTRAAKAITLLGYQPCLWQIHVVEAILKRDGDVLGISPLKILGEQNVKQLASMGLKGINITAETANADNFRARVYSIIVASKLITVHKQDIEDGKYRVIVTNVETLMQLDGGFEKLWKKPEFTRRLISIVWDEGHCVSNLFLVEPKRFDANIAKAEERALKRAETTKKRKLAAAEAEYPPAKRAAVAIPAQSDVPIPAAVIPADTSISLEAPQPADDDDAGAAEPPEVPDAVGVIEDDAAETTTAADPVLPVPGEPTGMRAEYSAERRVVYEAATVSNDPPWKKKTKKRGTDRPEPALDDFINARTRQTAGI